MHCVLHYGKGAEVLELRELCWMIYDDLKLTKKIYTRHVSISHP